MGSHKKKYSDSFEFSKAIAAMIEHQRIHNIIRMDYMELIIIKKQRDELIHPKNVGHLHAASDSEFEKLKKVFNDYDLFINSLMNDFHLSIDLKMTDILV